MAMFDHEQLHNKMNRALTKSLFHEFEAGGGSVILTLNQPDLPYPCLRKLFVSLTMDDPSEAIFAEEVFGDIGYWTKLRAAPFIQDVISDWVDEATIKRKSKAFQYIVKEVKEDGKNGYAAAKFLIEEPWKDKRNPKVKKEVKRTTSAASDEVHSDIVRLRDFV